MLHRPAQGRAQKRTDELERLVAQLQQDKQRKDKGIDSLTKQKLVKLGGGGNKKV